MEKVVLKENQLWDRYEYHLLAEKYRYKVLFEDEYGTFVASFRPPTRESKGVPIAIVSAVYTQRFYKSEGLKIPQSFKEMEVILKEREKKLFAS